MRPNKNFVIQRWALFCAQITRLLCFDLIYVLLEFNLANFCGLNFQKYTLLIKIHYFDCVMIS